MSSPVKVLTVRQPWATFIMRGVKIVECRPLPPSGDMAPHYDGQRFPGHRLLRGERLYIHAAATIPDLRRRETRTFGEFAVTNDTPRGCRFPQYMLRGPELAWPYRLPLGSILGSVKVEDVVPILTPDQAVAEWSKWEETVNGPTCIVTKPDDPRRNLSLHYRIGDATGASYSNLSLDDQRPFGVWTPGWWGLILSDAQRLGDQCPLCEARPGDALVNEHFADGEFGPCRVCGGTGIKGPIPATGKQGVWAL